MKQREGKIFNLKPEMTLAMKLAASFAITYYGLLHIYEIFTLVYRRYFIDSYYFNQGDAGEGTHELWIQVAQLVLSIILVFSLIQIFRKKTNGKLIFVGASLVLIVFQLFTTGLVPILKYILELLLVLIIAPIRIKKKIRIKDGKMQLETVEPEEDKPTGENSATETPPAEQEPGEEPKKITIPSE